MTKTEATNLLDQTVHLPAAALLLASTSPVFVVIAAPDEGLEVVAVCNDEDIALQAARICGKNMREKHGNDRVAATVLQISLPPKLAGAVEQDARLKAKAEELAKTLGRMARTDAQVNDRTADDLLDVLMNLGR